MQGFFTEVQGAAGVAALIGAPATEDAVRETLRAYRAAAAAGLDPTTGKKVFPDAFPAGTEDGPLFVAQVVPSIHYTMGGVATNS